MINHMFTKHSMGVQLPCRNLGCDKMFPSENSLKNHERYCQVGKQFTCIHCGRKYKRVKNLKAHTKNMHTKDGAGKLLCNYCGKSYESNTSYRAHYTNNQCFTLVEADLIQDIEDDDDAEGKMGVRRM